VKLAGHETNESVMMFEEPPARRQTVLTASTAATAGRYLTPAHRLRRYLL
jgi:hypothetical protein